MLEIIKGKTYTVNHKLLQLGVEANVPVAYRVPRLEDGYLHLCPKQTQAGRSQGPRGVLGFCVKPIQFLLCARCPLDWRPSQPKCRLVERWVISALPQLLSSFEAFGKSFWELY